MTTPAQPTAGQTFTTWLLRTMDLGDAQGEIEMTVAKTKQIGQALDQMIATDAGFRRQLTAQITRAALQKTQGSHQSVTGRADPVFGDTRMTVARDQEGIERTITVSLGDEFHLIFENRNGPVKDRLDQIADAFSGMLRDVQAEFHGPEEDDLLGDGPDSGPGPRGPGV